MIVDSYYVLLVGGDDCSATDRSETRKPAFVTVLDRQPRLMKDFPIDAYQE